MLHGFEILSFSMFFRFGGPPVVYINLIRDPVNRSVSHFYFRRYGDGIMGHGRAKNAAVRNEVVQRVIQDVRIKL